MPEGDTLWRTARALDRVLAGRTVTLFDSSQLQPAAAARSWGLVGRRVERVEARGKHLLIRFSGALVLHTHLGMHGGWFLRRPLAGRRRAAARIVTAEVDAVCLRAPVVELIRERDLLAHPVLSRLGPDLLGEELALARARGRLRTAAGEEIAVALLGQRFVAGIGNIYKSETLHACGVHPRLAVEALDDASLDRLITTARRLLQQGARAGETRTTRRAAPQRFNVYGRGGRPCPRCGTPIVRIVQAGRSTWFCPRCQPVRDEADR